MTTKQSTNQRSFAKVFTALALAATVAFTAGLAEARAGKGGSMGSRGSRTYEAPAPTRTAPAPGTTMDRSAAPGASQQRPGANNPAAAGQPQRGGFFSRGGIMGGIMGGLIGAGIAGMLFGGGFFDGLGSFAGMMGFLLQILLVAGIVALAVRFFRNRAAAGQPAAAGAGPGMGGPGMGGQMNRETIGHPGGNQAGGGLMGGGLGGRAAAAASAARGDEIGIGPADYQAFENLLVTVQTAYGKADPETLRPIVTPELLAYFGEQVMDMQSRGLVNDLSNVQLLQGDLAESWREADQDYATVAMRFSLIDVTREAATGRVVDGDANRPVEAVELWTFVRRRGGNWMLTAIQQAN